MSRLPASASPDRSTANTGPTDRNRWNARYRNRAPDEAGSAAATVTAPGPLLRLSGLLPAAGRAVDLAGGDGAGGLFLAGRGLTTTVIDVADVALERAAARSASAGLELDLERMDLGGQRLSRVLDRLGSSPPAVITCFRYLDRALLSSVASDLPTGSRFLVAIATTTNLQRHERPPARFLLDPGELSHLVVDPDPARLRVLHRREGWADGHHLAELAVEAR